MRQTTQQRLREALTARNMLPIELSRTSGIGKSAISQYLSGKVTPKQDKIYKLAQALKVNESWLMGYDEPMEQSPAPFAAQVQDSPPPSAQTCTPEEADLIQKYKQLDEAERELVDTMIDKLHEQRSGKFDASSNETTAS